MSIVFALAIAISGCNNLKNSQRNLASTNGSGGTSLDFNLGYGTGTQDFTLYDIVPNQTSGGALYDLIGQNGEIGNYCDNGLGTCICEYSYEVTGVGSQIIEETNQYVETDLLRCSNTVPSGVTQFQVRVILKDDNTGTATYASNSLTVSIDSGAFAGSTSFLDLSKADSFAHVEKFQCRKKVFIANPMDSGVIDPFQSEDTRVVYPFNFYSSNLAESLLALQKTGNQQWECSLTPNQDHSLHWWSNARVYSRAECLSNFCASDNYTVSPTTSLSSGKIPTGASTETGKSRASFWLAKKAYGVFQIPVSAAIAPSTYTASTLGVIGYAARPIPSSNGGSSSCPSITLPANSRWVKIWNFRATNLAPAKKVTSSFSILNSQIACHTYDMDNVFQSCDVGLNTGTSFGAAIDTYNANAGGLIGSRVAIVPGGANACYNVNAAAPDTWTPSNFGFGTGGTSSPFPLSTMKSLPWAMYTTMTDMCGPAADTFWRTGTGGCAANEPVTDPVARSPADTTAIVSDVIVDDPNNPANYTDQMFMVTDVSPSASFDTDMKNSAVPEYIPLTYRSSSDCNHVNPYSTAVSGECSISQRIDWQIDTSAVQTPAQQGQYPLCAVQFYD